MRQPVPFGKYLLLDRISVGGMAEVFRAKSYGVEGFEKIIAIKRILPAMGEDKDFIKMFIDEAKIAGQLSHANICQIFELGKIQGSHFIAMEYIWGKDLLQIQNRLRKLGEAMPVAMACYVTSKVCEGLDYAHRKKDAMGRPLEIIHRDCSPQNVLVSYEGEVKIIDFGIARAASRSSRTNAGVLKGKFGYMSPEQVRGLPLDHRSDLFAIGTCFYESLTGERLFQGESDFSTLEKVRNADVRPPSQLNQNIPPEVEGIVMRALTRDPKSRFESGAEMHAELQAFLTRQSVPFTSKTLADWVKRAFRDDLEREKQQMEGYKRIGRDGLIAGVPQARAKMDIVAELGQPPPIEGDPTALGGPSFEDMSQDELDAWINTSLPANAQLPGAQAVGGRAAPHGGARGKVVRSGTEGDWEPEEAPTEVFGEIGILTPPGMEAAPSPSVLSSALPPGRAGNGAGHSPAEAPSVPRAGRGSGSPPVGAAPPVRPPGERGPTGPNGPRAMPPPGAAPGGPGRPAMPPPGAAPGGPGWPAAPGHQPSEGHVRERLEEPRWGAVRGGSNQGPGGPGQGGAYPGMPPGAGGSAHASAPQGAGPHAFGPDRSGPVGPPPLGPGPMPGGASQSGSRGHRPLPGVASAAAPPGVAPHGPPPHGPPPHGPPNHGSPHGGPGVAYPHAPPPPPDGPRMLGQAGGPGFAPPGFVPPGFVPPGVGPGPRRSDGPPDHSGQGPLPGPPASVPLAGAYPHPVDPSAANRQTILGGRPPSLPPPPAGDGSLPAFYPVLQPGRPLYPEAGHPHSPYPPPPSARPRTSPSPQRTTRGLLRRGNATRDIAIGSAIVALLVGGILSAKFLLFGDEPEAAAVVPPTGTILVSVRDSQPAEVSIDGKLAGAIRDKTPLTLSALPPGPHTVAVTRAGAPVCERKVELGSRQVQVVECDFPKQLESGRLVLEGIGPGYRVFVDDQEVSAEAAREPLPLSPGVEHAIQVKSSAAGSPVIDEFTIEVEPGQELRRPLKGTGKPGARDKDRDSTRSRGARESRSEAEPEDPADDDLDDLDDDEPPARSRQRAPAAGVASAAVSSNQPGSFTAFTQPFARVYVDGKDTGKMTPIAPRSAISLSPGKHDITFVVGEQRFNYTITIAPGQKKNLVRTLPVK